MIFRIILICLSLIILFYFLVKIRKKPAQKIGISLVFCTIIFFSIFPDSASQIAHYFGVGRGVDFVFYLSFIALFFLSFNLYLGSRENREQITTLTRAFALAQARLPNKLPSPSQQLTSYPHIDCLDQVYLIMPAYYEGDLIAKVAQDVLQSLTHVVVIDDGSQDDTYVNACQTQAIVLKHVVNLGQGAALQTGFDFALSQGAKYVITFDSDGQHRLSDALMMLDTLCQKRQEAMAQNLKVYPKVALGSRFLGSTINMPASRKFILKLAITFTRWTSHISLTDTHNGLRVIDCDVLPQLRISQNRMAHASEILHQLQVHRIPLLELPVVIEYNERSLAKGQSALNAINIIFDLLMKRLFGA
jgi:hypothetical protein